MEEEELVIGSGRRLRLPPKLLAALVLVAALGAGFGLGYYTRGGRDGRGGAAPRSAVSVPPISVVPTATTAGPVSPAEPAFEAVSDTDERCSVQHGSSLQVGVQLLNSSTRPFVISYVRILLPLGGLRAAPVFPGVCGEVGNPSPTPGAQLDPGGTLWLTTRLTVLIRCPAALPVQFEVHFVNGDQVIYGFADLGEVPYSGCQ